MNLLPQKNGFTMIEIIIVVAIIAVVGGIILSLVSGINTTQGYTTEDMVMQTQILKGRAELLRLIRESHSFILPKPGQTASELYLVDKSNCVRVLYPLLNESATEAAKEAAKRRGAKIEPSNVYDLELCTITPEKFDFGSPPKTGIKKRVLMSNLKSIEFTLSSINSVSIVASFIGGSRDFQLVFESTLMNAGEIE